MNANQSFSIISGSDTFKGRSNTNPMHSAPSVAQRGPRNTSKENENANSMAFSMHSPTIRGTNVGSTAAEKMNPEEPPLLDSNVFGKHSAKPSQNATRGQHPPQAFRRSRPSSSWSLRKNPFSESHNAKGELPPKPASAFPFRQSYGMAPKIDFPSASNPRKRPIGSPGTNSKRLRSASHSEAERREKEVIPPVPQRPRPRSSRIRSGISKTGEDSPSALIGDIVRRVQDYIEEIPAIAVSSEEKMLSEKGQLERSLHDTTRRSLSLSNQLEIVRREKNTHLKKVSELKEENDELEARYEECHEELTNQRSHTQELEGKVEECENECENLKNDVTHSIEALRQKEEARQELEQDLKNAQKELDCIQKLMEENVDTQRNLMHSKEELENTVREVKQNLKSKTEEFNQKESMFSNTVDDLQQETRTLQQCLDELRARDASNLTQIMQLETTREKTEQLFETQKAELCKSTKQLRTLELEVSALRDEKDNIKLELENKTGKYFAEIRDLKEVHNGKVGRLEQQIVELRKNSDALEERDRKMSVKLRVAQNENMQYKKLEGSLAESLRRTEEFEKEVITLRERIKTQEETNPLAKQATHFDVPRSSSQIQNVLAHDEENKGTARSNLTEAEMENELSDAGAAPRRILRPGKGPLAKRSRSKSRRKSTKNSSLAGVCDGKKNDRNSKSWTNDSLLS